VYDADRLKFLLKGLTMFKKITAIFFMSMLSVQVYASGVDLKLADETAEVQYLTESSTFGYGGADIGIGFFFNEADDWMFSALAMVTGNSASNERSLQFGVGVKLLGAKLKRLNPDDTIGALGLAGQVRYVIPSETPVAFLLEGVIAPEVTSFSGAEQYTEYRFAVELEVTPSARAYIGYRNIEIDLENTSADYEIDDEVHLGVRLEF
jgi:YfaZ precursor